MVPIYILQYVIFNSFLRYLQLIVLLALTFYRSSTLVVMQRVGMLLHLLGGEITTTATGDIGQYSLILTLVNAVIDNFVS